MDQILICYLKTISGKDCRKRGCIMWQTSRPHADMSFDSNVFCYCGFRCWLNLTFNSGWLALSLIFEKELRLGLDAYAKPTGRMTVYLEEESGYILPDFSSKIIFLESTIVWCCHETYILSLIPDFWTKEHLRFIVIEDNPVSTLSLKTKIDDKPDLAVFFTYAGDCLDAIAETAWEMLLGSSNDDLVELKCGDRVFSAHKTVLSVASPVFSAMLQSDMKESRTGVVNVHGIDPEVFEQFVACLYSKEPLGLTTETAMHLYQVGDMYAVQWLVQECSDYLKASITHENAWEVLSLANAHNDDGLVKAAAKLTVDLLQFPVVRIDEPVE